MSDSWPSWQLAPHQYTRPKSDEDARSAASTAQCGCFRAHLGLLALCVPGVVRIPLSKRQGPNWPTHQYRLRRGVFLPMEHPSFEKLTIKEANQRLFKAVSTIPNYVLTKYLPQKHWCTTGIRQHVVTYFLSRMTLTSYLRSPIKLNMYLP